METPRIIARIRQERDEHDHRSYEEANWARLSPIFRAAHNRLRRLRGLAAIPEPAVDLYVPPSGPPPAPFDPNNAEFRLAMREHYLPAAKAGLGREGFRIEGGFHDMSDAELRAVNRDPKA